MLFVVRKKSYLYFQLVTEVQLFPSLLVSESDEFVRDGTILSK